MTMDPMVSTGAFHQASWPGAGDVDDCWAVADLQGVHAVAPWLRLVTIPIYRAAAGNPDQPGPTGGSIADSRRALRALYPSLQVEIHGDQDALTYAGLLAKVKANRPASVAVLSGALPPALQYGFAGKHRILVFWDGAKLRILNPLQVAHKRADDIGVDALRAAVQAYGSPVKAVIFPSPDQAFETHPLLASRIAKATAPLQARLAQIAEIAGG